MKKLENLSLREKILLLILSCVFAIFCALNLASFFFSNFMQTDINLLKEEKVSSNDLLLPFKKDNKNYLNTLYKLANQNNIIFEKVQNESKEEENFILHSSSLHFKNSFYNGLNFLNQLEQKHFKIASLSIQKEQNSTLNFKTKLEFMSIK